jgi:F-type H+-transporting ATPase subunit a
MERILPSVVFEPFGIPIRNTVTSTWAMMAIIILVVLLLRKRAPVVLEMIIDFASGLASSFIRGAVRPYVPFLGALFIFVAFANLIGIVPLIFTPTRDINTPVALALVVLVSVFVFGITTKGMGGFAKGFLTPLLPLDLIGYFSRTVSLAVRLFGNIIGGEMVVAVLFSLVPVGVPLIMVAFSSLTGILQAYVFTALAASYIASSVDQ